MTLPGPEALARRLLGRSPDAIVPLVTWDHRSTFRCRLGNEDFVCKLDNDLEEQRREIDGQRRAAAAGIPVPELVAAEEGALAWRFVPGVALTYASSPAAWRDAGRVVRLIHRVAAIEGAGCGGGFLPGRATWPECVHAEAETELPACVRDHGLEPAHARRIEEAIAAADGALAAAPLTWCHGDLQPDHVILDPRTDRVVTVIDWSDHGNGGAGWDLAVLTLDDDAALAPFGEGYGPLDRDLVALYRAVRLLGEVRWLHAHVPDAVPGVLAQLRAWPSQR